MAIECKEKEVITPIISPFSIFDKNFLHSSLLSLSKNNSKNILVSIRYILPPFLRFFLEFQGRKVVPLRIPTISFILLCLCSVEIFIKILIVEVPLLSYLPKIKECVLLVLSKINMIRSENYRERSETLFPLTVVD